MKHKIIQFICSIALTVIAADCYGASGVEATFVEAIKDSSVQVAGSPQKLVNISPAETRILWRDGHHNDVLVLSFMSRDSFDKYYARKERTSADVRHLTWVTSVPEVKNFCKVKALTETTETLLLRLKQFLGLNPKRKYDTFVEMWVDKDNLFRPCSNPTAQEYRCGEPVSDITLDGLGNYKTFYLDLFERSYKEEGAPWTRFGYTCDWGRGKCEVGATEFIVLPGTHYEIKGAYDVDSYCASSPSK